MSTSTLTLTVTVEHDTDIPTASEITRAMAPLFAKVITGRTHRLSGAMGRVAFAGPVHVRLDSAVVTSFGHLPVHYAERDAQGQGWNLMCRKYGEPTATWLDYRTAKAEAKASNEDPSRCGCAD
jgi:hypothetical protein